MFEKPPDSQSWRVHFFFIVHFAFCFFVLSQILEHNTKHSVLRVSEKVATWFVYLKDQFYTTKKKTKIDRCTSIISSKLVVVFNNRSTEKASDSPLLVDRCEDHESFAAPFSIPGPHSLLIERQQDILFAEF